MAERILLMSDIHGNLPALQAVVQSVPKLDTVYVAGDLCLDGPCPAEVLDLLRDLGWTLIMGNTDRDIVSPKKPRSPQVEWTRRQLGSERLQYLADLPFSARFSGDATDDVLVVHANPLNMDDALYPTMSEDELRSYLANVEAGILAFGHLHTPYVRPVGDVLLVDVSSVGHPKDHDRRSVYTIVTWDAGRRSIEQVRVPYDVEETVSLIRQSDMPKPEKQVTSLLKASY